MTKSTETEIELLKQHMDNIEQKMDEGFEAVIKRLDGMENKFADKWVEKAVSWFVYTVVGTVVMALLYLVVQKP